MRQQGGKGRRLQIPESSVGLRALRGGRGSGRPGSRGSRGGAAMDLFGDLRRMNKRQVPACTRGPAVPTLTGERGFSTPSHRCPRVLPRRGAKTKECASVLKGLAEQERLGAESQISDFLDKKFQYDSSKRWSFFVSRLPQFYVVLVNAIQYFKNQSSSFTQLYYQVLNFAMIVSSALMIWKGLIVVTGSESPIVVVLRWVSGKALFIFFLLFFFCLLPLPLGYIWNLQSHLQQTLSFLFVAAAWNQLFTGETCCSWQISMMTQSELVK